MIYYIIILVERTLLCTLGEASWTSSIWSYKKDYLFSDNYIYKVKVR